MTLAEEIAKPDYSGKSHEEALAMARAKTIGVPGALDAGKKLKALALADGLSEALSAGSSNAKLVSVGAITTTVGALARAGLANLSSERVDLEMDDPETAAMFALLVAEGVITEAQKSVVDALSMQQVQAYPGITMAQVVAIREPSLAGPTIVPVSAVATGEVYHGGHRDAMVSIILDAEPPSPAVVEVQVCRFVPQSPDDVDYSAGKFSPWLTTNRFTTEPGQLRYIESVPNRHSTGACKMRVVCKDYKVGITATAQER